MNEDKNITGQPKNQNDAASRFDCRVIPQPNTFENIDCMEMLKKCPDKHFDLAIVDPPYGGGNILNFRRTDKYENVAPPREYFEELFRVSKNQIIWGGNYFNLPISRGWILWYKRQPIDNYSDGELAWTSFNRPLKVYDYAYTNVMEGRGGRIEKSIHPSQKPVGMYKAVLRDYANRGELILDTHVGSGSSIIACIEGGFNYYGCEIDKDYYEAAKKRIARAFRKYEIEFKNDEAAI